MYFIFHTALSNLSFTGFTHAGYHIMIFNYEWFLTSAHVCKTLQFYFQLELVSIRPFVDSNRDGRHVPFFTSNCMFEARGCTIITIQGSQGEISDFTSNFWNSPLDTLNCNNKFCTFSNWYTGYKIFVKRQLLIPHKYFQVFHWLGESQLKFSWI